MLAFLGAPKEDEEKEKEKEKENENENENENVSERMRELLKLSKVQLASKLQQAENLVSSNTVFVFGSQTQCLCFKHKQEVGKFGRRTGKVHLTVCTRSLCDEIGGWEPPHA